MENGWKKVLQGALFFRASPMSKVTNGGAKKVGIYVWRNKSFHVSSFIERDVTKRDKICEGIKEMQ